MSRLASIILTVIVTAILTSILWVVVLVIGYQYLVPDTGRLAISVDAPSSVAVGEEFTLVVHISNPLDHDLELESVDLYDGLLDGFDIKSVTPTPLSADDTFGFTAHYYSDVLAPGDTMDVVFEMKAKAVGVWTDDIDCCTIDGAFETETTTIHVTAAP